MVRFSKRGWVGGPLENGTRRTRASGDFSSAWQKAHEKPAFPHKRRLGTVSERSRSLDILCPNPKALLSGSPGPALSAALGHHFAGPGNSFLEAPPRGEAHAGRITFAEDHSSRSFPLRAHDLCPRQTRSVAELEPDELRRGVPRARPQGRPAEPPSSRSSAHPLIYYN